MPPRWLPWIDQAPRWKWRRSKTPSINYPRSKIENKQHQKLRAKHVDLLPSKPFSGYRLKHLTSPELEIGTIVHDQIRLILHKANCGHPVHPAAEIKAAQEKFTSFVRQSELRNAELLTANNRKLMSHELGQNISSAQMNEYADLIRLLLRGFLNFTDIQQLLRDPSVLILELLDSHDFEIGHDLGVPARPKTDAVFVAPESTIVCDWKTGGARDEHRGQSLVSDLFVRSVLALPVTEATEIRLYYLRSGEVVSHRFTEDERLEMRWLIEEQFGKLRRHSDDPHLNIGPVSQFDARVSRACFDCNHRLMCPEFLGSELATL